MFATAGKSLNIYNFSGGVLESAPPYFPKSGEDIKKIQWCHDNTYIALLESGGNVEIVSTKDTNDIKLVHTIVNFSNVTVFSFKSKTKKKLAMGNDVGQVVMYDTKNRNIVKYLSKFSSCIRALAFSGNDGYLVALYDKNLVLFDIQQEPDALPIELALVDVGSSLSFYTQFPNKLAVGCQNGTIQVWDVKQKHKVARYERHKKQVTSVRLCSDDRILLSSGMDNKLCFLDADDEDEILHIKSLYQPITSMDVSPDNPYIVVGLEDGTLYIYDLQDHIKPLVTPKIYGQGPVNDIRFSHAEEFEEVLQDQVKAPITPQISPRKVRDSKFDTGTEDSVINNYAPETDKMQSNEGKDVTSNSAQKQRLISERDAKNLITKLIKNYFDELKDQLNDHCTEFEIFIANEFNAIHEKISRWDVFNVGDTAEVIKGLYDIEKQTAFSSVSKKGYS